MHRWALFLVLWAAVGFSDPPVAPGVRLVQAAREFLGTPYEFGGRLRARVDGRREGLDCQGLVFLAAERIGRCGWRSFSVLNVDTVRTRELGAPVQGLAPVASAALDLERLQPGDYLMLVGPARNPAEAAIGQLDGVDVWVWHVGLYAGQGKWIVGDHYAGAVVETDLAAYLAEHADTYSGVFVTRAAAGPAPARCRKKAP